MTMFVPIRYRSEQTTEWYSIS